MGITRINNNLTSQAIRNLNNLIAPQLARSFERLASGLRVNRAGDDAAGMSIGTRFQAQIRGLNEAFDAAQTGINLANVGDSALNSVTDNLLRIRELTVRAGNSGIYNRSALQAIQAEINQNVDEIGRVANTTQFSGNTLFNGDYAPTAGVRGGTPDRGVNVDQSNLTTRENYLQITQVEEGGATIVAGEPAGQTQIVNTGIGNVQDVAVSQGAFTNSNAGAAAAGGDVLTDLTFNGVSMQNGGQFTFRGTLADGTTEFSGTIRIDNTTTLDDLGAAMQSAIDAAETGAGINTAGGTNAGETNVAFNATTGRLEFRNGAEAGVSDFNVDFTQTNAAGRTQNTSGVTRATQIGGQATGAQTGNAVNAFTGSTFDTGDLRIEVSNVTEATQRVVRSGLTFEQTGGGAVDASTNLIGSVFNGATLAQGDTITINGANADGTTFSNTITVSSVDGSAGNGAAVTFQDLIDELNMRDQSLAAGGIGRQSGFTDATAAITTDGRIQITDDIAGASQSNFNIVVNDRSSGGGTFGTIADAGNVVRAGNAQEATVRVNGGPAQRVQAGQTATLYGNPTRPNGEGAPQITLRMGTNLTNGTDIVQNTRDEFLGSLNGGPEVRFSAGEQDVTFTNGIRSGETLTVDFDANVDVPGTGAANAETVVISAAARQANFQIGAYAGQSANLSFGDIRPGSLGLGAGRTVNDIDITKEGGVDEALRIIDEALDQVGGMRSGIGAFSNRLEATSNSLAVASENLTASRSRIMDTDYAAESVRQAINEMLLQANIAIQSQTNNLQNNMFSDLIR
ncbi:MAG: hypothetical protein C4527_04445 [Candidatus Omnitrophota bacterium]|jgi:flagellin|nr:MAG: hypothetical protein C4527_04445 [Candidatus Omnitrophota bacterium]